MSKRDQSVEHVYELILAGDAGEALEAAQAIHAIDKAEVVHREGRLS